MHADALPITGPCPIDLDAIGFDRTAKVAHCTHCVKSVTVLSNMTKAEAREFLRENEGKTMCVSYARDEAGRIRFRPEPEPVLIPVAQLRPRTMPRASRAAGLVAALGVTAALAACAPHGEPPRDVPTAASKTTPEPPEPVETVRGGTAVLPKQSTVDGGMRVPSPDVLDEPCDKGKPTGAKDQPRPTKPDVVEPIPTAGVAMIPPEAMIDGEMEVPSLEAIDEPRSGATRVHKPPRP